MGAALRPALIPASSADSEGVSLSAVDIGFAQDMSVHHEQALFISQNLDDGVAPVVFQLAQQIIAKQTLEIGTLRGWLTLVGAPLSSDDPMAWMRTGQASGHGHHDASKPESTPMPGMATWDEINTLAGLQGREAETYFLQLMIRHHQGGVDMATAAARMQPSPAVERMARAMVRDQTKELGYMNLMLQQREAQALPYP